MIIDKTNRLIIKDLIINPKFIQCCMRKNNINNSNNYKVTTTIYII